MHRHVKTTLYCVQQKNIDIHLGHQRLCLDRSAFAPPTRGPRARPRSATSPGPPSFKLNTKTKIKGTSGKNNCKTHVQTSTIEPFMSAPLSSSSCATDKCPLLTASAKAVVFVYVYIMNYNKDATKDRGQIQYLKPSKYLQIRYS